MTPTDTVENKCTGCGREWTGKPGALGEHFKNGCPDCGSLYWESKAI